MIDDVNKYSCPYEMGKKGLRLYELNILNNPGERERIGKLFDDCTAGHDNEADNIGIINYEWDFLYNFLKDGDKVNVDVIDTDEIISFRDLKPEWRGDDYNYNHFCVIEVNPKFMEWSVVYEEIAKPGILVAVIYNENISKKLRYNFIYK